MYLKLFIAIYNILDYIIYFIIYIILLYVIVLFRAT